MDLNPELDPRPSRDSRRRVAIVSTVLIHREECSRGGVHRPRDGAVWDGADPAQDFKCIHVRHFQVQKINPGGCLARLATARAAQIANRLSPAGRGLKRKETFPSRTRS